MGENVVSIFVITMYRRRVISFDLKKKKNWNLYFVAILCLLHYTFWKVSYKLEVETQKFANHCQTINLIASAITCYCEIARLLIAKITT